MIKEGGIYQCNLLSPVRGTQALTKYQCQKLLPPF